MTNQVINQRDTTYTLTLKMTTAQVVETSVTANNSPIQDYARPDDHAPTTYEMSLLGLNLSQYL